tara:strand:+ start:1867 stop:2100 length:234 start_codon:yes stop_codon:yes gene_type:complete
MEIQMRIDNEWHDDRFDEECRFEVEDYLNKGQVDIVKCEYLTRTGEVQEVRLWSDIGICIGSWNPENGYVKEGVNAM